MTSTADREHARQQRAAKAALSRMLEASGLGVSAFGPAVLGVDRRTLRRWLAGDEIPAVRAEWLISATIEQLDDGVVRIRIAG